MSSYPDSLVFVLVINIPKIKFEPNLLIVENIIFTKPGCRSRSMSSSSWKIFFAVVAFLILYFVFGTVIVLIVVNVPTGETGTFSSAAVAADAGVCSTAGVEILNNGGSAVDAAIAAHLCIGVANLHSAGIGGGGFMVIHIASSDETFAFDFREVAPGGASVNMYNGAAENAHTHGKYICSHMHFECLP